MLRSAAANCQGRAPGTGEAKRRILSRRRPRQGSALAVSPECSDGDEPVADADLLAFRTAPGEVADGHFHDARARGDRLRRDLVVELEAARRQLKSLDRWAVEQLQRGDRVGEV